MNKQSALEAFRDYTSLYDTDDIKIKLKIDHTYRVSGIAERIGAAVGADKEFCWFLGLLHDIGRFEQLTQYGTFIDRDSVDHAELGADILFSDGLIESFPDAYTMAVTVEDPHTGNGDRMAIAEAAVRLHNKLALPDSLDAETMLYCKILRDADKVDIFRVLTEPPYDARNEHIIEQSRAMGVIGAREDVMRCVHEHRCVPKTFERTDFESLISQCCMAFELYFPISRETARSQLATLRAEMERAWDGSVQPSAQNPSETRQNDSERIPGRFIDKVEYESRCRGK